MFEIGALIKCTDRLDVIFSVENGVKELNI